MRIQSLIALTQITTSMGPTWGPPGSCRPQMGPVLAQWTFLSGKTPGCLSTLLVQKLEYFGITRSVRRLIQCVFMSSAAMVLLMLDKHITSDIIMGAVASQITSLTIVYSTVYSDTDERKHQSCASLAFVWGIHRGPVNSPHKWSVTRNMFPFDDVIMSPLYSTKKDSMKLHKNAVKCSENANISLSVLITNQYLKGWHCYTLGIIQGVGSVMQWVSTLQCYEVSNWLIPYPQWSLHISLWYHTFIYVCSYSRYTYVTLM